MEFTNILGTIWGVIKLILRGWDYSRERGGLSNIFSSSHLLSVNRILFYHLTVRASSLVPDKKPAFRHNFLKFKDGFKMLIWCNSCDKCKGRNGWKGYSEYSSATRQISRKCTPITEHGDFHAAKRWNPLTSKTENELKEFVANKHILRPKI